MADVKEKIDSKSVTLTSDGCSLVWVAIKKEIASIERLRVKEEDPKLREYLQSKQGKYRELQVLFSK